MGFTGNIKGSDAMMINWLSAIRSYVDLVQSVGHSQLNPSPLLADGFDVLTHQPVVWEFPDGHHTPISNFASQQNWLRTLDALSLVTQDPQYHQQAQVQSGYFMQHGVHNESGLFYWGGHRFLNLDTLKTEGPASKDQVHELKHHLPYYDLLVAIDREKTLNFLQGFWHAHVEDWQTLDLGRHGNYSKQRDPQVFTHPRYDVVNPAELPKLPETKGLTFVNAGTDLIYAAYKYAEYTGDAAAAAWGKHLYRQYVLARNPETGLPVYQFSSPQQRQPIPADDNQTQSWYGDRAKRQFGPEFGEIAREANVLFRDMRPLLIDNPLAMLDILRRQHDAEVLQWVIDGLKNYYRFAYDVESNTLRPLWNDGQDMSGYVLPRDGYYGTKGTVISPFPLDVDYLLPLVRAWRLSEDEELLDLIGVLLLRWQLAELNKTQRRATLMAAQRPIASPYLLLALVELAEHCQCPTLFALAWQIGDDLFKRHYHRGLFVESAQHRYFRIDNPIALALLTLIAAKQDKLAAIPQFITNGGYIHGDYRVNGESRTLYDIDFIYPTLLNQ
ncbi:pectate lyase [Yersinia pseudotuberculosis]|uniref:pectate lyase n=1 Tax=Yersinia pseudotuberculosis TaxID=633 RepID=UPI0005E963F5|nr:pectate lyase [Yersinia pseudotuberculosis]CNC48955.1 exopolygalacturonate lyase [Yersinia pseudotuberculosis]